MDEFLMGMALLIVLFIAVQFIRYYRLYKKSLYRTLYGSYLEWFVRYYIKKDLSSSSKVETYSKYSRILFHSIYDQSKTHRYDFVLVVIPGGLSLFVLVNGVAFLSGKKEDKLWKVKTAEKQGKIDNIYRIGLKHQQYVEEKLDHKVDVNLNLLVLDTCDVSRLDSSIPVLRAGQLEDYIVQLRKENYSDGELMDIMTQLEKEKENVRI